MVKITAVKVSRFDDLIAKYENPIQHACSIKEGQVFYSENGEKPSGLCDEAWKVMKEYVESLAQGKGNFFDGWMKDPMSAMISCNDGFRPVSFYIEVVR